MAHEHDPRRRIQEQLPPSKGLQENAVGLFGGTVIGISCVAPAYALTATLGILVAEAGAKMPAIIIAGFLPMFFAAYAYREFNKVSPDCGTSFTWTTKAFGPYVGWMGGWAAILATVIVLSNLAGVGVQFFYQFLGQLIDSPGLGTLWQNSVVNVLTCLAFLALATVISYRGITTSERIQIVLVIFQLAVLLVFAVVAIAKSGGSVTGLSFDLGWFSPSGLTTSAFIAGLSGSIFAFWGWDSALTVNEESAHSDQTPGRAALLAVVSILITYLLVAIAVQMYAGVGEKGLGLANGEIADNVFGALAGPVLGSPFDLLLFLAVLASSAASLITTFLPASRTMLGMAAYRAFPPRFAAVHPVFKTPSYATLVAGVGAGVFYAVLTFVSESVLTDTIYSLGLMICFYYGLVAFGCVWFFRRELFDSAGNIVFKLALPLLGGIGLFAVFLVTLRDSASPDYGSGAEIGGVGLVLILGLGLILLGIGLMLAQRLRDPAFFRGETLTAQTEALVVDEP